MTYPEQQSILANAVDPDTVFAMPPTLPAESEAPTPGRFHLNIEGIGKRVAAVALGVAIVSGIVSVAEADPALASNSHTHTYTTARKRMLHDASTKLIAAHRGDLNGLDRPSSHYAENTIPNDLSAIRFFKREHKLHPELQLKNLFIEGDIQFTKDGKAMWFHDSRLNRITNCSGPIAHKTAAQLGHCAIDISRTHSHIPFFSDVVKEVAPSGVSLMPELKPTHTTPAEVQEVANALTRYGMNNDRTVMQSFHTDLLKQWKEIAPNVPGAQLQNSLHNPLDVSKYARYILLNEAHTSNADVNVATRAGLSVGLWTVDTANQQRRVLENPNIKVVISSTVRQALTRVG